MFQPLTLKKKHQQITNWMFCIPSPSQLNSTPIKQNKLSPLTISHRFYDAPFNLRFNILLSGDRPTTVSGRLQSSTSTGTVWYL